MFGSLMNDMYKVWLIFDPRKALLGLFAFLIVLAVVIHMILLSTDRFNWLESGGAAGAPPAAQTAMPAQGQTQ